MLGLIADMRLRAEQRLKQTLMGAVGMILVCIGCGFGVSAAWLALEDEVGAIGASLIIGAVFLGLGLLILSLGSRTARPRVAPVPPEAQTAQTAPPPRSGMYRPTGEHPPMMEAFLLGVSVYLETKNRRR